ncbi:hypothetical protein V8C34DRAFT_280741, partial [Trichoderma compactum]
EQEAAPAVHSEVRCGDGDRLSAGGLGLVVSVAVSCSAIQERAFFFFSGFYFVHRHVFLATRYLPCMMRYNFLFPETERQEMGKKIWKCRLQLTLIR